MKLEKNDDNESDFLESNNHDSESEQLETEYESFVWGEPDYVEKDRQTKFLKNTFLIVY